MDNEDQQRQQEKEKKDDNFVGTVNSAYTWAKRAKWASGFFGGGGAAAGGAGAGAAGAAGAGGAAAGGAAAGAAATTPVWVPVAIVAAIIILIIIILLLLKPPIPGLSGGGDSSGQTTPGNINFGGLDYFIPFRDPSILPDNIRETIVKNWPNAQMQYFDTIVSQAQAHNWNPTFVLALWIEESGGSYNTKAEAGGVGVPTDNGISNGHLGCAVDEIQQINESLSCLFKAFDSYVPSDKFADFMCNYDQGANAPCVFNNQFFPKTIKSVYSTLVPNGPGALVNVPPPGLGSYTATCPIPNGIVTCGSRDTPRGSPLCGHCNPNTSYASNMNQCTYDGINYAEDVGGSALQDVVLPSINGESIIWRKYDESTSSQGVTMSYKGLDSKDQTYVYELHHVEPGSGKRIGLSGDVGAKICSSCNHVHIEFYQLPVASPRQYIDAAKAFCI